MLRRNRYNRIDNKLDYHSEPKVPTKMNKFKELQTHNMPTNDVENTDSRNSGRYILLVNKPHTLPRGTERMLPGNKGKGRAIIY